MTKRTKFLDKKITMGENIGNILVVVILIGLAIMVTYALSTSYYQFEDLNGNIGESNICYTGSDGLYCRTDIKVEWYGEK